MLQSHRMKLKRLLSDEWDAIAGLLAAVVAIILHLLHIVDEQVTLPIVLALLGLLFINFMRHTRRNEDTADQVDRVGHAVRRMQYALKPPDLVLVGPRQLRSISEQFARHMSGDAIWFNVGLSMCKPRPLFDALLRPALENPPVGSVQFVLDASQQGLWEQAVWPKMLACGQEAKVREPRWCNLSQNVPFILADSQQGGGAEALLSFWGEPSWRKRPSATCRAISFMCRRIPSCCRTWSSRNARKPACGLAPCRGAESAQMPSMHSSPD